MADIKKLMDTITEIERSTELDDFAAGKTDDFKKKWARANAEMRKLIGLYIQYKHNMNLADINDEIYALDSIIAKINDKMYG